jgi:broad specificity phosphatase PhoE
MTSGAGTVLHLVRHGEVDNPSDVLYGQLPGFHLSDAGRSMARAVAESLRRLDIGLLLSSPLERAQETAEPLARALGLAVEVDDRLRESASSLQGLRLPRGEPALLDPRRWWTFRDPFTPSWGEPYQAVAARMLAACADARKRAAGRHAVLVSHQAPIWVTRRAVEGRPLWHRPDRRLCALASVTSFDYRDGRVVAIGYSEPAGPARRRPPPRSV